MARGAALPKSARYVLPGRPQVRLECEHCGVFGSLIVSATPARAEGLCADKVALACPDCGGRVLPSNVEDCERLAPHLLARHPVFIEDAELLGEHEARQYAREREPAPSELCEGCGWRKPDNADPDCWYCHKCRGVNAVRCDGSRSYERAKFRSVEYERAMGLRVDRPAKVGRKVCQEPQRVDINRFKVGQIATPNSDIPF